MRRYVPCSVTNCCIVETNVEFAKRMRTRGGGTIVAKLCKPQRNFAEISKVTRVRFHPSHRGGLNILRWHRLRGFHVPCGSSARRERYIYKTVFISKEIASEICTPRILEYIKLKCIRNIEKWNIFFLIFVIYIYIYNTDIVKMQYDAMWQVIVSERIKEREYSNK